MKPAGRERLITALEHKSGSIPLDFGSTAVSGIHVSIVEELRNYFGFARKPVKIIEPYQMLGEVDGELKNEIGIDTESVLGPTTLFGFRNEGWKEWKTPWDQDVLVPEKFCVKTVHGDLLIFPEGDESAAPSGRLPAGGFFIDSVPRQKPFREEELNPADNTEEFTLLGEKELLHYELETARAAKTGRAVVATLPGTGLGDIALVPAPFMKNPRGIRDVTEWYISTVARQDYVHAVFEKQTEVALANLEKIHSRTGDTIDVVFVCGTDFGTQTSKFCSRVTFRSLYLPYYRKINNWIHGNTRWKTFKHTCGAIAEYMDLFIEAGFDIINPVQLSAAGMDARRLKDEFGDKMVYWGGGVDTQKTLPFGTAAEVKTEVLTRCEQLGRGGGFVFNTVHNVQAKTPLQNIVALIEVIRELR